MRVMIQAINAGHKYAVRAGRFFDTGALVAYDVVEGEADPRTKDGDFEPGKISQATFEALKADPRFRILSDKETQGVVSEAAVKEARKQAAQLQDQVTALSAENAELKAQLESLTAPEPSPKKDGKKK